MERLESLLPLLLVLLTLPRRLAPREALLRRRAACAEEDFLRRKPSVSPSLSSPSRADLARRRRFLWWRLDLRRSRLWRR